MCVGHAPFRSESSYSVLRLITDKEPRPIREVNSEVPEWLCAIIRKLMSKSPDDRFASANEVAIIFERCLAHVQDPIQHALPPVTQEFHERSKTKWMIVSRLQRWFPIMNDKRIVSLILLLIALLVPWPIATIGNVESALALAVPAALQSLGLALLSRSEYFSRIVLWCFGLDRGHSKSELHLDFRPLPANFTEDQFLVVLKQEAIDQLKKLGIENIVAHFLNKEIEATGRILATTYTARGMPGGHFHLIVSDLKQISFSNIKQD